MKNGWTGGQYSVFRWAFGLYLSVHFTQLIPWAKEVFSNQGMLPDSSASPLIHLFPNVLALVDSPLAVTAIVVVAAIASLLFAVGFRDRILAVVIWYLWACLFGRNPLIGNPSLPFVGWMLLAHAVLPSAPFGSWDARGRLDPAGAWRFPDSLFGAGWIVLSVAYTYSGWTKLVSPSWIDGTALARILDNPLARPGLIRDALRSLPAGLLSLVTWASLGAELLFAPLALVRRARPWIWAVLLGLHVLLLAVIDFADLSLGMIFLHFFTFDPAWIGPRRAGGMARLYYDGSCGLCHRAVRFVIAEDTTGQAFRFAPLGGESFCARVAPERRRELPDSLVVLTADGNLKTRSEAVVSILQALGGLWRLSATLFALFPAALRNAAYDRVAAVRFRLFAPAKEVCPLLPAPLRERFET